MNVKTKVGIIGCGAISSIYFEAPQTFDNFEIAACADIDMARAHSQAEQYQVPKACSVAELLADPEIEIIINLTIPKVHAEISLAALAAHKSVYSEKPMAISRNEANQVLQAAQANGLRFGCAPDTFLGGGLQTCRKLIDDGWIGRPVATTAFMLGRGPESWHPNPEFFYQPGAGPLFDMGPYYLTALVALLGPVRRVSSSAGISFPERTITNKTKYGQKISVTTPTHVAGTLDFSSGAIGTLIMSFDAGLHQLPRLEIYGSEGTLSLPDPNTFGGPIRVARYGEKEWREIPFTHGYTTNSRGIGVADMVDSLNANRPHRASAEMAYHIVDIMESLYESSESNQHIQLKSECKRPAPLAVALPELKWSAAYPAATAL
jgi:predicted dehydrogenase